jgi:hypothetical protein
MAAICRKLPLFMEIPVGPAEDQPMAAIRAVIITVFDQ